MIAAIAKAGLFHPGFFKQISILFNLAGVQPDKVTLHQTSWPTVLQFRSSTGSWIAYWKIITHGQLDHHLGIPYPKLTSDPHVDYLVATTSTGDKNVPRTPPDNMAHECQLHYKCSAPYSESISIPALRDYLPLACVM